MNKRDAAMKILVTGGSLFVKVNPKMCQLPLYLKNKTSCILEYGLNLPVPIPDLYVIDDGIHATLSFQRAVFKTFVPWGAVQALSDSSGAGRVYPTIPTPAPKHGLRLIQGGKSSKPSGPIGPAAA